MSALLEKRPGDLLPRFVVVECGHQPACNRGSEREPGRRALSRSRSGVTEQPEPDPRRAGSNGGV